MKKYLITGCAGFIGSNFVHYMLKKYPEILLVNLDKLTYAGNLENLQDIEDDARHIFVQGDICDKALVTDLIAKYDPDYVNSLGGATVNRVTLERVRYGARLARQSGLPVLVSGGTPSRHAGARGPGEAELMKKTLEEDFRVPVKWVEGRSLDTRQNADFSAQLLLPQGVKRVVLVTHAAHMHRSVEAFEHAGLAVIPAPTAFFGGPGKDDNLLPKLPGINTAYAGGYAAHEWVGILAYRLSR